MVPLREMDVTGISEEKTAGFIRRQCGPSIDIFASIVKNTLNLLGGVLIVLFLLSSPLCMLREDIGRSHLISTLLAGVGICAIFLALFSSGIVATGSVRLGYVVCTILFLNQKDQLCPGHGDMYAMGQFERTQEWQTRLQIVQFAIVVICGAQMLLGLIGLNVLIRVLSPLSVSSTTILLSLHVVKMPTMTMAGKCPILFAITCLVILTLYFMDHIIFSHRKDSTYSTIALRNKLYIGLLGALMIWAFCALCSNFDLVTPKSAARTDTYDGIMSYAPKLRPPNLLPWAPKWKSSAFFVILPAAYICIMEVLIQYYINNEESWSSCHRAIQETRNYNKRRARSTIIVEAICCLFTSVMGLTIGVSVDVGSSSKVPHGIVTGLMLILMAIFGNLCALLTTIPEPIVAAFIVIVFLSILMEGIHLLKCVNLTSSRNVFVLSVSLLAGLVIPRVVNDDHLNDLTGCPLVDEVFSSLISTEFLIGGLVAVFFDNIIGDHREDILMHKKTKKSTNPSKEMNERSSIPFCDCLTPFFA